MRRLIKKLDFFQDERGFLSAELAVVVLPFLALVVAIVETHLEQIYVSHLDRAVRSFAEDLRSGVVLLRDLNSKQLVEQALSAKLCPRITVLPGFDCQKLQAQLFRSSTCSSGPAASCWQSQYADFNHAVRNPPTFVSSSPTFIVGGAGDSQYLTVYYPFRQMSSLWNTRPTATVNGAQVYGLLSTAMWVNDPTIGVF